MEISFGLLQVLQLWIGAVFGRHCFEITNNFDHFLVIFNQKSAA